MANFKIKNLNFYYPTTPDTPSLKNVNLDIEEGGYITVCGRSGSGKTTLLKHLKTVLTPHGKREGEILFDGRPLDEVGLREQSSRIGFVMQNPDSQIVTDKVWHELAFGLESLGMEKKAIRLRVAEMASYFGIQDWFHKDVSELSGGQKQLLNLASVMAMQPDVLILDEPTSQLDPIAASDFLNTVKKINLELRTTIVITEHRLEDILYASDKVVVMEDGLVQVEGNPRDIGNLLREKNSQMFSMMPTPVQVFYGVQEADIIKAGPEIESAELKMGNMNFNSRNHNPSGNSVMPSERGSADCPLTVREGGDWLSEIFAKEKPGETRIDRGEAALEKADRFLDADPKECPIVVKEAWFRYEKESPDILRGVTLKVPPKSISAIVGGNGTGKSTFLKSIIGVCKIYRGKILIAGKKLEKYRYDELFRNNIAMLPQDPSNLFVKKTVREELEEMVSKDDPERVDSMGKLCQIEHLYSSHPYDLSGGEQQRVALAKVLLTNPGILLLDEPTKGIDSFFKKTFAGILSKLKEKGVTILMVTHDVEFCAKYADVVSMFFDGSVVTTNLPHEFFSRNSFYTTAANRMSRHIFENAITDEDLIELCKRNM
ncbi:MAG: energy-coupling factor transporter ATPase [Clostridiales bacterium]|nr:energy-coupling factor transporter ATPase [Clostridiales bacterium]MDY4060847.1 energy-coupling factor transporter ATPase [Anaerovoracaceae bacterium]